LGDKKFWIGFSDVIISSVSMIEVEKRAGWALIAAYDPY
jgi:hypothetical protein